VTVAKGVSITTTGSMSGGIWSASIGDPTITIEPGARVSGGPGGAGVYFAGPINTLNNSGWIGSANGINGHSVISTGGYTTINNSGISVGNITLGGSGNVINNHSGGRMYLASQPDIGADGVFYNSGFLQFNPQGVRALAHFHRPVD
jgi:hypothetical protein